MQTTVLVTDGGPHPPEKWAAVTASQLIDISATAPETKIAEARKYEKSIIDILTYHHGEVMKSERGRLAADPDACLLSNLDPSEHVARVVTEIVDAAKGLSFEKHFAKPETQKYIGDVLASHFASAMHIERSWAGDDGPAADAHRAKHGITKPSAAARAAWLAYHHPGV